MGDRRTRRACVSLAGLLFLGCGVTAIAAEQSVSDEIKKTEDLIRCARELREKLWQDPQRPVYHFMAPSAWMNDPNGAIYWKGRYHLFYQHNPEGGYQKWMHWGHASSVDLVHWVHHPIALAPTPGGPDRDGCFSGGAFINKEGVPTLIYHGVPDGTCLATSRDDLLIRWEKHPGNPVIKVPKNGEAGYGVYNVFDPSGWVKNGSYYAVTGNVQLLRRTLKNPGVKPEDLGDTLYLFKSKDLTNWEYVAPFYKSQRRWTDQDEDCAVPDFFSLGGKYMLFFASHTRGGQYYLGRLEGERFVPESHGRLNFPGGNLWAGRACAPITMLDGKGRRILFVWVTEARNPNAQRIAGWSGVMTLPRVLSLAKDGTLRMEPAPEVETLRYNHRRRSNIRVAADSDVQLAEMAGDTMELSLQFAPLPSKPSPSRLAFEFGLKVRSSPDGSECTTIAFEPEKKAFRVDVRRSCLAMKTDLSPSVVADESGQVQTAPFELAPGEALKLRIFLDRSVLEVFANGRQCLTQRIYPTRRDSRGVTLYSRGQDVSVRTVEAWDMAPAHE